MDREELVDKLDEERQEKEAIKSAKETIKKKNKNKIQKIIWNAIKAAVVPIAILFAKIMAVAILIGVIISLFINILDGDGEKHKNDENYTKAGVMSIWGCDLSREEFIEAAEAYNGGEDYDTYLAAYAGEFYDICTEYDINPCYAYAHAFIETGGGSSSACKNNKNYFGYGHYNNASSGVVYSSVEDSIEDYCEWIVDATTEGTSNYDMNYTKGQEYAEANDKFEGTPANNIYVLFSTYAYLGDTHICDEPDFDNPMGIEAYKSQGSNWGTGGRIQIYYMYEMGGLYENKYKELCGHSKGTDPTTTAEKADYAQYTVELRIKQAKAIFGEEAFTSSGSFYADDIVTAAINCHKYLRENGYTYSLEGITVPDELLNGRTIDCSSYVTWVLYCAGYEEMKGYQQTSYTFNNNPWGWQEISVEEAAPGDIVVYNGHVEIIAGTGTSERFVVYSCGGDYEISTTGLPGLPESVNSWYKKSQVLVILRPSK